MNRRKKKKGRENSKAENTHLCSVSSRERCLRAHFVFPECNSIAENTENLQRKVLAARPMHTTTFNRFTHHIKCACASVHIYWHRNWLFAFSTCGYFAFVNCTRGASTNADQYHVSDWILCIGMKSQRETKIEFFSLSLWIAYWKSSTAQIDNPSVNVCR